MHAPGLLVLTLLLVGVLPAGGQVTEVASMRISEILADPDAGLDQREFVELWNPTGSAIPLAGWKLRDAPTASGTVNTFTFSGWSVPANGRVVVWGGGIADGRGPAWSNPTVWNNAGDAVTLVDAAGQVVDWFGYGSAVTPSGFANQSVPPAAPKGQSLQQEGSEWVTGPPTPAAAPGAVVGTLVVEVANVGPVAAFGDLPSSVRPGWPVTLSVVLSDQNGDNDVATWTLRSGDGALAAGSGGGVHVIQLTGPPTPIMWSLNLTVTDQAGATSSAAASIPVRTSDLVVVMPQGPLQFVAAAPGEGALTAGAAIELRNEGPNPLTPLLDVSPFAAAAGASGFAAEGHVLIGWGVGLSGNVTWTPYAGPLSPLPVLAPGERANLTFRLHDLPGGLAAGSYGASFAVVAQ